jgi:hypothetical protein
VWPEVEARKGPEHEQEQEDYSIPAQLKLLHELFAPGHFHNGD